MSLFLPLKRATLLVPSGTGNDPDRKHLFILLTDPIDDGSGVKKVLMVSISSLRSGVPHDPTCVLYPGDHPFIKRESFVFYARTRIEETDPLLRGVKDGKLVAQDPMESGIFARICKGLEESRFTPSKILKFYQKALSEPH